MEIQEQMSERAIELLALSDDEPRFLLDLGCGSGLSGSVLEDQGHIWVGLDISPAMLGKYLRMSSSLSGFQRYRLPIIEKSPAISSQFLLKNQLTSYFESSIFLFTVGFARPDIASPFTQFAILSGLLVGLHSYCGRAKDQVHTVFRPTKYSSTYMFAASQDVDIEVGLWEAFENVLNEIQFYFYFFYFLFLFLRLSGRESLCQLIYV